MSALKLRHRLLLLLYPKGPRRGELADTLLMAEENGGARSRRSDLAGMVWHGPRARLGRPNSRRVVVLAVIVAVLTGFIVAGAVNWAGWMTRAGLPSDAKLADLQQQLAPGRPASWSSGDGRASYRGSLAGGIDDFSISTSARTDRTQNLDAYLAGVDERLQAAGWQITTKYASGPVGDPLSYRVLDADKDGLTLYVLANERDVSSDDHEVDAYLGRVEPHWLTAATFAGGLIGFLLGWLLIGWASRRLESRPVAARLATISSVSAVVLLAPSTFWGFAYLPVLFGSGNTESPLWQGLDVTNGGNITVFSAAAASAVALLAAASSRPLRPRSS